MLGVSISSFAWTAVQARFVESFHQYTTQDSVSNMPSATADRPVCDFADQCSLSVSQLEALLGRLWAQAKVSEG